MHNKDYWLREFTALRCGNLVYLATLKCACTHYIKFFSSQDWQKITADQIDWTQDHVFSFIMEPMQRRLKGLAEFVWGNQRQDLLTQDSLFWGGTLYMDMHSVPYTLSYGNHCEQIDWIPLDSFGQPPDLSETMLCALLQHYGLNYELPSGREHVSNSAKIAIYDTIKQKTGNGNFAIHLGLSEDIDLYHRVCSGIRPWLITQEPWTAVSWLNKND